MTMSRRVCALWLGVIWGLTLAGDASGQGQRKVGPDHAKKMQAGLELFKTKVRRVFIDQCLKCHGGRRTRADFDLSSRKALLASGAIASSHQKSKLYLVIAHKQEPHMPHRKPKLPEDTVAAIAKWIDLGAPYDRPLTETAKEPSAETIVTAEDRNFWSFQPLRPVSPPKVRDVEWVNTPIDRFILSELEKKGIAPNGQAPRRNLIRRVYFDLIGLPPEPEAVERFVADPDPKAYEKLVDRLLASPHFGERWARHWMDVARFAESHGYEQDYKRPHAYHYRDFLIKAFNADMPYDQFVRWQIAGDELARDDPLAWMATGFLCAGSFPTQLTEREFESSRYDELDDMVSTMGTAFLGLTIGCARCHNHKYDPIPTYDYYRLVSNFTTAIRSEVPLVLEKGAKPTLVQVTSEGVKPMKHHADGRGFPHFYKKTYFLKRGDVNQKQGEAKPGYLQVLMRNGKSESHWRITPPPGSKTRFHRASLANWLTDVEDGAGHLLARVIVNRLWHHHFGRGIVATPNDFGMQGERPTHPELLDWLAADLIRNGWKLKRLHKMIVTSAVYMQSSQSDPERMKVDRGNRYLWRWKPRRLEAEPIRDALLAVAGLLDKKMYGPGSLDENMRRRSVYFFIKRSKLIPMMMLFDWPEHLVSIGRRAVTTTAPQALMFMNSPQARQYAQGFAKRIETLPVDQAIDRAFLIAFARPATSEEKRVLAAFIARQEQSHAAAGHASPRHAALTDFCQTLMSMNEFIYID